jgi:hypothetical protein
MTQNESSNVVIRWFSSLPAMFRKAAAQRAPREVRSDEEDELMEVGLRVMGNSVTSGEWRTWMREVAGWGSTTFDDRLREFKRRHPELGGCRWQGDPYWLDAQPTEAMAARVSEFRAATAHRHLCREFAGTAGGERERPEVSRATPDHPVEDELVRLLRQLG